MAGSCLRLSLQVDCLYRPLCVRLSIYHHYVPDPWRNHFFGHVRCLHPVLIHMACGPDIFAGPFHQVIMPPVQGALTHPRI